MSDIFEAPQPFNPDPPAAGANPPAATNGNGRKKRGPRRGTAQVAPAADPAVASKPAGKKRGRPAKGGQAVSRPQRAARALPDTAVDAGSPDVTRLMSAVVGLDEAETNFVASVVRSLNANGKKSRAKIAAALGRIFG